MSKASRGATLPLLGIGLSLAERRLCRIEELPEFAGLTLEAQELALATGIESVIADDRLDDADLLESAARAAIASANIRPCDLSFLIITQPRVPDKLLLPAALQLQHRLEADRALAFSVGDLGCVSINLAMQVAHEAHIARDGEPLGLVATSSKPATKSRIRGWGTVTGDGGGAAVVGGTGPGLAQIDDIRTGTLGAFWDLLSVPYRNIAQSEWKEELIGPERLSGELVLQTRSRLLDRLGGGSGEILMPNLSVGANLMYSRGLSVEVNEVCTESVRRYGHMGGVDMLLNLHGWLGTQSAGQIVAVNASPAAAWGTFRVRRAAAARERTWK